MPIAFPSASRLPKDSPVLDARQVHLWCAPLDQPPGRVAELRSILSDDERDRAERFRFDRDRRRFAVARATLRELLGAYLGEPPASLTFDVSEFGKPSLASGDRPPPLQFNLSHSDEFALFAFAQNQELGVDLEAVRTDRNLLGLATAILTDAERAILESLPEDQLGEGFYNAWTRKEAYLKALGRGLSVSPRSCEVSLRPGVPPRLLRVPPEDGDPAHWSLYDLRPHPGVIGALAIRGHGWNVSAWTYPASN